MPKLTDPTAVYQKLQRKGFRLTQARRSLIAILMNQVKPLSVVELMTIMRKKVPSINITTIYRELDFLHDQDIIHEIQFAGNTKKYFEFGLGSHHHHIRCLQCNGMADVDIPHSFTKAVQTIQRQTKFKLIDHSLEFVGICAQCQKKL